MKIQFKSILSLCIVLITNSTITFGHKENSYYLYSKIGDLQIGMRIDEFENVCTASYVSTDNEKEKVLRGTIEKDSSYVLYGFPGNETKTSEKLIIKQSIDDSWSGKWFLGDSIVKKVFFKPINIDSLNHPYINAIKKYKLNAYFAYKTKDIVLKKTKIQKLAPGMKVIWYSEAETGIEMFRVDNTKQLPDVKEINELLTVEHLSQVSINLSETDLNKQKYYRVNCSVNFLNSDYLCYTITIRSSYNGQHENLLTNHYTRSIKSTQKVMLEDIIWFGEKPQPKLQEGEAKWFTYRYKVFGEKVLQILSAIYPENLIETEGEKCNYSDIRVWQFPTWYITKKGIYFGSVSQTMGPKCNAPTWSIIPWEYLKKYLVIDNQNINR